MLGYFQSFDIVDNVRIVLQCHQERWEAKVPLAREYVKLVKQVGPRCMEPIATHERACLKGSLVFVQETNDVVYKLLRDGCHGQRSQTVKAILSLSFAGPCQGSLWARAETSGRSDRRAARSGQPMDREPTKAQLVSEVQLIPPTAV